MWLLESARLTLQRFFIVSAAFARDSSRDTLPFLSSQYFNNFSGGGNFLSFHISVFGRAAAR